MSRAVDIKFDHCRAAGSDCLFFRAAAGRGWYRRGAFETAAEVEELLAEFERLTPDRLLKNSRSARIGLLKNRFIKRYNFRNVFHALKRIFRTPRPTRCLDAANALKQLGIPTPEPLAALRRFRFGVLPDADFLITTALPPDSRSLDAIVAAMPDAPDPALVLDLCRLLARLHAAGFEHGDLSLRNLYAIAPATPGAATQFGLIDLDGAKLRPKPLKCGRRRRELARLISSLMRCRRQKNPETDLVPAAFIRPFAAQYQAITGIDLDDGKLAARVAYLFHRTRKTKS